MTNKNNISIYASSVNGKEKKELLAIYHEYVMLVNLFEYIQKKHHPQALASIMNNLLDVTKSSPFPFTLKNITIKEKEDYNNFLKAIPVKNQKKYAYINILTTKPDNAEEPMYSVPKGYEISTDVKSLPHLIERINIAYPEGSYPDELTYNVNGKYILTCNYISDVPIKELLNYDSQEKFSKTLSTILTVISNLPENFRNITMSEYEKANIEGNITELMSEYENIILSSLSNLTEKQDRILKQLLYQRERLNYLSKAESQGLIKSETQFQDLLNIRHLLHHQFDTLEGFGRFMNGNNEQNKSIRQRNLESYNRLFNKTFAKRISTYREMLDNLKPLVEELCPNILIRQKQESNSKFIQRIKQYVSDNPDKEFFVELDSKDEKTEKSLSKNILKLFPKATIIDISQERDFVEFAKNIQVFMQRQKFLETFQLLDSAVCTHCLYNGENLRPLEAWAYLAQKGIIKEEDVKRWNEFKTLRNELTHEYLDANLLEKMNKHFKLFVEKSISLNITLDSLSPQIVSQTDDGIITFIHKDNKVVVVDAKNKKVLHTLTSENSDITPKKTIKAHSGSYVENLSNNIKITTKGTRVTHVKLNSGVEIDISKQKIIFPDNNKIFLNENGKHYFVTPQAKLITDKDFIVLSYIQKQKNISFDKNEILILPNGYIINIDNALKLKKLKFTHNNKPVIINTQYSGNTNKIVLNDNTAIAITKQKITVTHNSIELNYKNRQAFADSYKDTIIPLPSKER